MGVGTIALLSALWAPGQTPTDTFPINHRNIQIPIKFEPAQRATIRELLLFVSRNQGQSWEQEGVQTPEKDSFPYFAPGDGVYWFVVMVVTKDGQRDPPDLMNLPRDLKVLKVLVDTLPPGVRIKAAERVGNEILAAWEITESYPDLTKFRLEYKFGDANAPATWVPVDVKPALSGNVRIPVSHPGPVTLRVGMTDLAGNHGENSREVPAAQGGAAQANFVAGPAPTPGAPNGVAPVAPLPVAPLPGPTPGVAPVDPLPSGPAPIGTSQPQTPAQPVRPAPVNPPVNPQPLADPQPRNDYPRNDSPHSPSPLAVSNSPSGPPASGNLPPAQIINVTRFDMAYEVEQRGPSGVSRVELWVTRDDGRTWHRWSQVERADSPLTVELDNRMNPQIEGLYGFRIVLSSGAGLSKGPPVAGDVPDLRVDVDITPPLVKIYEPLPDPNQKDTLILRWEASDRNMAADSITLEWSESPNGPWQSVVASVPAPPGIPGSPARRLANTGSYAWHLPTTMPSHRVYLRVTARDAAGNVAEARTPQPILVDLNKPVAHIQGIIGTPTPRR